MQQTQDKTISIGQTKGKQFTPFYLDQFKEIVSSLDDLAARLLPKRVEITPLPLIHFFCRYLAGGESLKTLSLGIDLAEFLAYMQSAFSGNQRIKLLARQSRTMIQGKTMLKAKISLEQMKRLNLLVVRQKARKGLRNRVFWVGNPKIKPYAYQVCSSAKIKTLMDDCLVFLHDESLDLLSRLIVAGHQFAMIHPFKDGNGRTWRCVFWQMLSEQYDEVQVLLMIIYFKLINSDGLYQAQYTMKQGDPGLFIDYWNQCIDWSLTAHDFYRDIFSTASKTSLMTEQVCALDYYLKAEKRNLDRDLSVIKSQ